MSLERLGKNLQSTLTKKKTDQTYRTKEKTPGLALQIRGFLF